LLLFKFEGYPAFAIAPRVSGSPYKIGNGIRLTQ